MLIGLLLATVRGVAVADKTEKTDLTKVLMGKDAKAHPLIVEQKKPVNERGYYISPELYGQSREKQTEWGRHPVQMRKTAALAARRQTGPAKTRPVTGTPISTAH